MNQNKIKIIAVLLLLCISAAWLERYEIQESGQNLSGQMADKMKQNTDEPENLYAQSAVLMDADSGRVLFGKEEEAIRPMASTTKIMTCIIALEHMTDNEIVTASAYAASAPLNTSSPIPFAPFGPHGYGLSTRKYSCLGKSMLVGIT